MMQNLIPEDNVEDWDWDLIELCLRGAVNQLESVQIMKQRYRNIIISSKEMKMDVIKCEQHHQSATTSIREYTPSSSTTASNPSSDDDQSSSSNEAPCKRPCLGRFCSHKPNSCGCKHSPNRIPSTSYTIRRLPTYPFLA